MDKHLELGDFIPISLHGSLYKLVVKVLAARMAMVIYGETNLPIAIEFSKGGTSMMDGVVALNEVLHLAKVPKCECFLFKVDFEKARDFVSWYFLHYML